MLINKFKSNFPIFRNSQLPTVYAIQWFPFAKFSLQILNLFSYFITSGTSYKRKSDRNLPKGKAKH